MTEFLMQWHMTFMDVDRVPTILMAMLLCVVVGMITGPLAGNANPLIWRLYDVLFGKFGERMDRKTRSRADLMFRGFIITALTVVIGLFIGKAFVQLQIMESSIGVARVILLSLLFTAGTVWFSLLKLYFVMEKGKAGEGAYYAIAHSTRINLAVGDEFGITRAAMGYSVRSFDKGLVAPALWYLIGGFPLASVYAALAALSWRLGKNGLGKNGFADVPLALERLMGIIPSLLAAMLITMATFITPTSSIVKGVTAWLGHKDRAPYEQGGAPLSALAWALNVSLGGAAQDLSGNALKGAWVGPKTATAQINHKHLRRAIYLNVIAHILFVAALLGTYMWGGVLTLDF